ncbi:PilZ domain-containing protein [Microvirga aerophila]|uniref:PilZ domain-containing protein n=1 Tax=Microvirga aerophila TaxID=670291 RepID=A0A512C5E6_9HYPH|nr:PilZ domain-containing protein [Microvirga aerophila]GEO19277.1 hypothetical protein MAE02_69730 [Microvirga aerophila]
MIEKRSEKRWHTVLKGQVVFNNRGSVLDCTVQDLSNIGARIYFTNAVELPPEFELEIPSRRLRLLARRIWSREASHGVMFLEKAKAGTVPPAGWPRTSDKPAT